MSEEPARYTTGHDLADALAILERAGAQLARAARRHERLDAGRLDWLARQVGQAAALVRAAWEAAP